MTSPRYTNVADVPLALAVFFASDNYDYNNDQRTISATTLLKPLRQIILPARLPDNIGLADLGSMAKNRMGAAIHDGIEQAWRTNHHAAMSAMGYDEKVIDAIRINPTAEELAAAKASRTRVIPVYLEQRASRKVGDWTVTGKFDFVGEGRVQDFKTTSTYVYMKQVNKNKYPQQGSLYRWLSPTIITEDSMDIHYLFTDWKAAWTRTDPNYPPRIYHRQRFDLMSEQATGQFVERKLALIEKYMDAPEEEIPLCEDEDLWRKEPEFKYYKNPAKTNRSTKNFTNRQDAYIRLSQDGNTGIVKEIPGQVVACKYCDAFMACTQKDQLINNGELLL